MQIYTSNNSSFPDQVVPDAEKQTWEYGLKVADIQSKSKQANDKMAIEQEKIKVARENMANDLAVAKENAKGRNNKKS